MSVTWTVTLQKPMTKMAAEQVRLVVYLVHIFVLGDFHYDKKVRESF